MAPFTFGPFAFEPGSALRLAGAPARRWAMHYGGKELAARTLPADADRAAIIESFADDRAAFVRAAQGRHAPDRISLIDFETGDEVAAFYSENSCGMTPGLIDDRSRYWLRSADGRRSRDVTLAQYAQAVAQHAAPPLGWVTGLLSDEVLTHDPEKWAAPTSWEIRHVVGEGSFTGLSGAKAAALVGVTPQNFRKYTAADGAVTRQRMSFAMWHLLLHRLGVQRLPCP